MPRFNDQWLIDRALFDYVQGGSCACCSFNFLPNGNVDLIKSMSEFETDTANAEINALDKLPWPPEMKDQVWMERVRIRQFCKRNMLTYKNFWTEHGSEYKIWFMNLELTKLRILFQLPRQEIVERLKLQKFQMHGAFGTVLCAVTEQVANFHITKYPPDGRGIPELKFESCLKFDRRCGFTLNDLDSEQTKQAWLLRHQTLGGPKLLERNPKKKKSKKKSSSSDNNDDSDDSDSDSDDDSDEDYNDNNNNKNSNSNSYYDNNDVPSFRSDRRIVRLVIARHFADVLQRAYLKEQVNTNTTSTSTTTTATEEKEKEKEQDQEDQDH